jgi:hypothetical protein
MSIRVAFRRFCSLISKGGGGPKVEKYLRTARRVERMDLLSTTGGRRIVKCLYRKTLLVVERLVTTNVKGASSPRMLLLERKERREEKGAGHAGWEFWPASNDGWGKASERRRVAACWVPCRALGCQALAWDGKLTGREEWIADTPCG